MDAHPAHIRMDIDKIRAWVAWLETVDSSVTIATGVATPDWPPSITTTGLYRMFLAGVETADAIDSCIAEFPRKDSFPTG